MVMIDGSIDELSAQLHHQDKFVGVQAVEA